MDNQIREVIRYILESRCLVVLTGAGVSTESGISDFRSPDGIYARWDRNRVFDFDYFRRDPAYFYRFAKEELYRFDSIEPNQTHHLLALLEEKGLLKMLLTQNIDGLHQKAGSRTIIELHGGITEGHCLKC
ncbi:MAG: NAD-dependent protein deacylase, partial [Thermotogaceae bacterium]|nr:NAD-dependent protein deacylase [Thermotogaceae bacterium]